MRIQFILGRLDQGGAERQLIALLQGMDGERFLPLVTTYYPGGLWEDRVKEMNHVAYESLQLRGRLDVARMIRRLHDTASSFRPHIVFGLMGDACTAAVLCRFMYRRAKVVWGLRATDMDYSAYSLVSAFVYRLNALISFMPDLIVSNSWSGVDHHSAKGYRREKMVVIPNGIDTIRFRPSEEEGARLRSALGIGPSELVVGRVGRMDPMKDYETFLKSAEILLGRRPNVRFLVAGGGDTEALARLKGMAAELGISQHLVWLGKYEDVVSVYNASTITCSSSAYGEGFPNVIGESLACQVLCAATDVGDSRIIIGEEGGIVVPPRDPYSLSNAMDRLLSMDDRERVRLGRASRKRVEEEFGIRRMVDSYEKAFERLLSAES